MAFADHTAASKIRVLREQAGYNSAETLATAIRVAAAKGAEWGRRGTVDAWTIRKIEEGHVPGPRIRFVLASFFDVEAEEIWQQRNWKPIGTSIAVASRKATNA